MHNMQTLRKGCILSKQAKIHKMCRNNWPAPDERAIMLCYSYYYYSCYYATMFFYLNLSFGYEISLTSDS
jgi:hypothetical protein